MNNPTIRLAPMAGITDWPFRLLCFEQGCDLAYSEMISAMGYLCAPTGNRATEELLTTHPDEGPLYVQLFGKEPDLMEQGARAILAKTLVFQGVDINMGCPAKKIAGAGEGSGLMRTPKLAEQIMQAVRKATVLPVTVKFRLGWDENSINVIQLCKIAQDCGMDGVAVHGRTRMQQYSGKADWDAIAMVKQAVSIPVYGNGDVFTGQDAKRLLNHTGCDGLLIGRGALGNPWIFQEAKCAIEGRAYSPPTLEDKVNMALRHADMLIAWQGEKYGIPQMRKHVAWYINGVRGAAKLRAKVNYATSLTHFSQLLKEFLQQGYDDNQV